MASIDPLFFDAFNVMRRAPRSTAPHCIGHCPSASFTDRSQPTMPALCDVRQARPDKDSGDVKFNKLPSADQQEAR
ncbi:hypothetical protein [Burkholderia ubonensis]|uniref:hypothetical protein n=1 Tax=Burkholderia ubonensis TaxID=101571 RepID=UPI00358DFC25